jgi:hypothetical protein
MQDCFHRLLLCLSCYDTIYIVCGGINYTFRHTPQLDSTLPYYTTVLLTKPVSLDGNFEHHTENRRGR